MILVLLLGGVAAGVLAGTLGLGGGLVLVPLFLALGIGAGWDPAEAMPVAVATSLAAIFFTGISSALAHHRRGALPPAWRAPLVAAAVGAGLGAWVAPTLGGERLQWAFALFEAAVGLRFLLSRAPSPRERPVPRAAALAPAAGAIGAVSALLGIGGGTLSVPWFSHRGLPMVQAVALSSLLGVGIALGGSLVFLASSQAPHHPGLVGWVWWQGLLGVLPASLLVAPLGARLAHRLPVVVLRRVFGGVLLGVALAVALA